MTDKTVTSQLSPAAQAVLDAASEVYWDWEDMVPSASHTIAAAALRAVANHFRSEMLKETSTSFAIGILSCAITLEVIAEELEAQ